MPPSNQRRRTWLLLAASISIHTILLSTTRRIGERTLPRNVGLLKRFVEEGISSDDDVSVLSTCKLEIFRIIDLTAPVDPRLPLS